jgi:hypothetical protein
MSRSQSDGSGAMEPAWAGISCLMASGASSSTPFRDVSEVLAKEVSKTGDKHQACKGWKSRISSSREFGEF